MVGFQCFEIYASLCSVVFMCVFKNILHPYLVQSYQCQQYLHHNFFYVHDFICEMCCVIEAARIIITF